MKTLVVSDLHLGGRTGVDLIRRPSIRATLVAALGDVERLVLLGDTLELRHGPLPEVLERVREFFAELARALDGRPVVIVPGNHDHQLVMPWLEDRRLQAAGPLGLAESYDVTRYEPLRTLAGWLAPSELTVSYPGLWLRDDVYAIHGHYGDRHITIPTFERVAVGVSERLTGRRLDANGPHAPDDYEAALGPVYAWNYARAQAVGPQANTGPGPSARAWMALGGDGRRTVRTRLLGASFKGAVGVLNRGGLGPLRADLSSSELRRAGLRGAAEVVDRLGITAQHVVYGHTHRAGPLPGDDRSEWRTRIGTQLHNSGSWVFEPHFLATAHGHSPYWPGTAIVVGDSGEPRLERLLGGHTLAQLKAA